LSLIQPSKFPVQFDGPGTNTIATALEVVPEVAGKVVRNTMPPGTSIASVRASFLRPSILVHFAIMSDDPFSREAQKSGERETDP
jgi:hypothetical protein